MRKIKLLAALTVMMTMLISLNAYAAEYFGEEDAIEITGGIDMDKEKESTFNDTRTITGRAEKGANITINVCIENEDYDEFDEEDLKFIVLDSYDIEIGVSGYFSKNIKLFEGENIIIIGTEDNSSGIIAYIKRKDVKIKDRLERGVCIPGSGFVPYMAFAE
ncbi:hypothetical protein IMSAG049_00805 [Clostridiales bacterium]|nr:hypothetical protein IMSAG049_00805 [Clostridiales bacterium]